MEVKPEQIKNHLIEFESCGKHAYFDLVGDTWTFYGDCTIDESAQALFERVANFMPKYFNIKKYKKDFNIK